MLRRTFADFRAACRNLARSPLFSLFICALLAIGLGANTIVYTLIDKLLLRPLAIARPTQLLRLGVRFSPAYTGYDHPYLFNAVFRDRAKSFSDIFVSWPLEMSLNDGRHVESVSAETVSGGAFSRTDFEQRTDVWLTMAIEKFWFTKHDNTHAASHIFLRLKA